MPKLSIIEYIWPQAQRAHKGHNRPDVAAGAKVFAIQHIDTGLLFSYAYIDRGFAGRVCERLEYDSLLHLEFNFKKTPYSVSDRKED